MATKPSPTQTTTGAKVPASKLNESYDIWQFTDVNRPMVQITQSVAQSISTATATAITFTSEVLDKDNQHESVTNPSRITLGTTLGWYLVWGQVAYANNATGSRRAYIRLNGATLVPGSYASVPGFASTDSNPFQTVASIPVLVQITSSTDYVELMTFQFSGGSLSTVVNGGALSSFSTMYLGTFQ